MRTACMPIGRPALALALGLVAWAAGAALAQRVTGQWDFNEPDNGFRATVGADGYVWNRPAAGDEQPEGFPEAVTEFDFASAYGIAMEGDDGGVMSFGGYDFLSGLACFPDLPPNGGGSYVNQYTLLYDVYFPLASADDWRGLWQTNECNTNDGEFFISEGGGIGISGAYDGVVLPDTWHRIVFSVDLTVPKVDKFIDGVLVSSQTLGEGVDGRWALYTADDDLPSLLFTDNDNETAPGFCGCFQIRNYPMTEAEVASFGTVSLAGNIPTTVDGGGDAMVAGQWTFDDPGQPLVAAIGRDLAWFKGCQIDFTPGEPWLKTALGTTDGFGIAAFPDLQDGGVVKIDGFSANEGFEVYHDMVADVGLGVNQYTLIYDVYFPAPLGWHGFIQINDKCNSDDGEFFLRGDGGIGISGDYDGAVQPDTWHRIAFAVDLAHEEVFVGGEPWTKTVFDTTDGFGIAPFPDGADAPVMYLSGYQQFEAIDLWHDMLPEDASLEYVNQYTVLYDIYVPALGDWMSLWQTQACNTNDGDIWIAPDGYFGHTTRDAGPLAAGQWYRIAFTVDGFAGELVKYVDGAPSGSVEAIGLEGRMALYSALEEIPAILFGDNDGETLTGYISCVHVRDYPMSAPEIAALGGASSTKIPLPPDPAAAGVVGQWNFAFEFDPFFAEYGQDLTYFDGWRCVDGPVTEAPLLRKYIDGELVDTQILGSGVDGRWAIQPGETGHPLLLMTDNDDETIDAYLSSFQLRDYMMTTAELAALGGAASTKIPSGPGVAGQWDFEDADDPLLATVGHDLAWFTAENCLECDQDLSFQGTEPYYDRGTYFGSVSDFEFPLDPYETIWYTADELPDGPPNVMYFDATIPCTGYLFPHGARANGGGFKVNEYTVIMDLYIPIAHYFRPPIGHDPGWIALYQTWPLNDGDAMLWIRTEDGALGDDGSYGGTGGFIYENEWVRVVAVVDNVLGFIDKYVIYANDTYQGPVTQVGDPLDGKRALWTRDSVWGEDFFLAFSDESFETHRGLVSSIQIRDYLMEEGEVLALGGPRAAGIPIPPGTLCKGDTNCDGQVDLRDINPFSLLLANPEGWLSQPAYDCPIQNGDINNDGVATIKDINPFVALLTSGELPIPCVAP